MTGRRDDARPALNATSMTADVVATIEDLHVSFRVPDGTVHAVRGVDLHIRRGEIMALVGESGSGKSVLGSCLLGMPPDSDDTKVSGRVQVAGYDMVSGDERLQRLVRRNLLGAVFQDPLSSLNPLMRISAQLTERGVDEEQAMIALRDAGIAQPEQRMRQWPHELSGGLRQRVMIAMALAANGRPPEGGGSSEEPVAADPGTKAPDGPLLIVADEPTTALDVSVQAQIVSMFDRLRAEHGCSILLVTHDLGVAAAIADRIVVLYAGRVCEVGPTAALLSAPRHPYTAGLLRSRLSIDGLSRPTPIVGSPPDPLSPLPGCAFAPRCENATTSCTETVPTPITRGSHTVACFHPMSASVDLRVREPKPPAPTAPAIRPRPSALRLESVSKSFAGGGRRGRQTVHAVRDVTLDVPIGGASVLVGESGCGKSTLLRMATGILKPDSGSVHWPIDDRTPQLVFQDAGASLTPWLTIERQIKERLAARGIARSDRAEMAMGLLVEVGLDSRAARCRPRELSGGQRQRAAIARALANQPKLLICDEPVSALDASLAVRVLDLLEGLRESLGLAILLVTHDLAVARRLGDDVAVMYLGRIVERAPTAQLFDEPQHPYTRGLLDASPTAEPGRLAPTLLGEPPTPFEEEVGCGFRSRCAHAVESCATDRPELVRIDGRPNAMVACPVRPFDPTPPRP